MKPANTVLHILPHAGGGVGVVLCALLAAESKNGSPFIHSVATLEQLNNITRTRLDTLKTPWYDDLAMQGKREILSALVEANDIVLLHWWNHPLLMQLLFNGLPPARIALWSHVNGFFPPQSFFPELFELPDRFVFATPVSRQAPVVQNLPEEHKQKLRVIRSCSGIPTGSAEPCVKNGPFQMGYVGTVEPVKMHQDFLEFCAAAQIATPCIVAGGPAHEELQSKAERLGLANRFKILGPVSNPTHIFQRLHAFAYPLNPMHYGTGEQVLIEAMAFGAVPVVLANLPEMDIVRHGETGLVAKNGEEFSAALRMLRDNPVERDRLAAGGRRFVTEACGIEHGIKAFHLLFEEMLKLQKRPRRLHLSPIENVKDGSPFYLFLSSCGNSRDRKLFEEMAAGYKPSPLPLEFTSTTRGTPYHYLRMLGDDPNLERICKDRHPKSGPTS